MIKLENTIISLKDHQKDINNKLANAVTKLKKQIGLVEANAINKIDSITVKIRETVDTLQKNMYEFEYKAELNNKQLLELKEEFKIQYNELRDTFSTFRRELSKNITDV